MSTHPDTTIARELAGKVALVTGGARNIGRAIAIALAAGGASVVVNARTQSNELHETMRLLESSGVAAASVVADVTDADDVQRIVRTAIDRFGRLDALVNNASVRVEQPFDAISFGDWRRILSVVLDGAFLCCQAALPHLRASGGGTIVNIGGETGHAGAAARAHVVTAKAGIAGFTKALALDLAGEGITVIAIAFLRGDVGLADVGDDTLADPRVLALAAKVRYVVDPDNPYPQRYTGHVRMTLADGGIVEERQPHIRGGVHEPLSRRELERKFVANLRFGGYDDRSAHRLLDRLSSLLDGPLDLAALRGPEARSKEIAR